MERLLFASMRAVYRMESRYIIDSEENYCSVFSSKLQVYAQYDRASDEYLYVIDRLETLLNSKPAEKLMDRIMCEAGASLYPVHLRVSPKLWIQEVMNFDEVKQRRQTCIRNWLEKTPSSELERYARFSEKNMANRKSFISSLYNDVFYNLYFRDIYTPTVNDEVRLIRWSNFPERETEQSYLYSIKQDGASFIRLSGELMKIVPEHNGKMETMYEMGDEGEIRRITGKIEFEVEEHVYMKQFVLETEMNETINNKD